MPQVKVKLVPTPDAPQSLEGAIVDLVRKDTTRTAETNSVGECAFSDIERGRYTLRVRTPPTYYGSGSDLTVTVNDADVTKELPLPPLLLTVTLPDTSSTGWELPSIEIRDQRGSVVAAMDLRARDTKIPIPLAGRYEVVQTRVLPGYVLPPESQSPKVDLLESPASTVSLPQKRILLKPSVTKPENGAASIEGVRFAIRDSSGGVMHEKTVPADGVPLRRTGPHTVQVVDIPAAYVVDAGDSRTVDVEWTDTVVTVAFTAKPVAAPKSSSALWASLAILLVVGLLALAFGFVWWDPFGWFKPVWQQRLGSVAVGLATVAAGLSLLTLAGKDKRGLFSPLVGADGRISTSRVAPFLWSFVLMFVIMRNAAVKGWSGDLLTKSLEPHWDDYLILLGGPFAAAVLAKGFVSWRVANGQLQKTENTGAAGPLQALQDDSGNPNLIDAQYLLFNVVALAFFTVAYAQKGPNLPKIPNLLLALTSSSAALYVSNKAVDRNKPVITGVAPATVMPGDTLTIGGQHFVPPGSEGTEGVTVTIEGYGVAPIVGIPEDTKVTVQVPATVPPGLRNVTVTTAARVTTEPRPVEVVSDQPEVIGITESTVVPGEVVHVLGRNLRTATESADGPLLVAFGNRWVPATLTTANGVLQAVVTAPRDLPGSSVQVAVRTARGRTSNEVTLPLPVAPALIDVAAARPAGQKKVVVTLTARGVLPPSLPWPGDQHKVVVNGTTGEPVQQAPVAGATDRLVVTVELDVGVKACTVLVHDWQGRQSAPREVTIT